MGAYQTIPAGYSHATELPTLDFETYSEAGCLWDPATAKWRAPKGAQKKGLSAVGTAVYAAHPSTEVLMLWYDLRDGRGRRYWDPMMPPPADLLAHVEAGGLLEAHHSFFELNIWNRCCVRRYGWPPLQVEQLRDSMAKAQAWALPGKLEKIGEVLDIPDKKHKDGERLIQKFSVPRNPTKNRPEKRTLMADDPKDAALFIGYGEGDIIAEHQSSVRIPDLPPDELEFWLADQRCNWRGVGIDTTTVDAGVAILDAALDKYNAELSTLTGGTVERSSQTERLKGWLGGLGVSVPSFDEKEGHIDAALARPDLPPQARRALEIRQLTGSASVKKLYALQRQTLAGRAHGLFVYHRARTGRDGGADIQPQNLPKAGPEVRHCGDMTCQRTYGSHLRECPYCHAGAEFSEVKPWSWEAVADAVEAIRTGSLEYVEHLYGEALLTLSGCIRGLFVPAPGYDFLCSDYSSIEAVVTAMLAGEQWRIDAFERGDDIYLRSASRITGTPYGQYAAEKAAGHKPADRQNIGKPAELGLGFGGWIAAWKQFDKSGRYSDDEIKKLVLAWRDASPAIVELWGGQCRGKPWKPHKWELYGLEGAAIAAVQNPGECYRYRFISYQMHEDVLYCRLPSGRLLAYHRPRLAPSARWDGQLELSFEGYNSNPKMGPIGWIRIQTYGGRLCENAVQATARDFLRDAAVRLEREGYPMVLRVHDEIVCEVPEGFGTIAELERLMEIRPEWAADWPIRAAGGWRGKRYRKD